MRTKPTLVVAAIVAASVAARVPFLQLPLSSDEAGFLTVAAQWGQGGSLYGDYWVDRPPLLVALYGLAGEVAHLVPGLDSTTALRLLGVLCAALSVVLAAALGRQVAPQQRWAPALTATVCAVLLSQPLLGMTVVDGELLAVPFVLAGLLATHRAAIHGSTSYRTIRSGATGDSASVLRRAGAGGLRAFGWAVAAGAAGSCAFLVKQNFVDALLVLMLTALLAVRRHPYRALTLALGGAAGAILCTAAAVWFAAQRGTDPLALWHAVVTFRLDASEIVAAGSTDATTARARQLILAALLAGLPAFVLLLPWRPRPQMLPVPLANTPVVLGLVGWEVLGVAAGGSYWLHYLVGLVPSAVLLVAAHLATRTTTVPVTRLVIAPLLVSMVAALAFTLSAPPRRPEPDRSVIGYLQTHARPGDTAVVAFGHPDLLRAAGLTSPYPDLWSLPVRVRDPRLRRFTALLTAPRKAPTWVIQYGASLGSWGIDATRADVALRRHYRERFSAGDLVVFEDSTGGH